MGRPPIGDVARTEKLFVRVEPDVLERLDAVREIMIATMPPGVNLTRTDVVRALILEGLARHEAEAEAPQDAVAAALRDLAGKDGLVFVPDLQRQLRGRVAPAAVISALLEADRAGAVELRPESGVGLLASADAAMCPTLPDGTVLSYARIQPAGPARPAGSKGGRRR